jgi:hypothetical protein
MRYRAPEKSIHSGAIGHCVHAADLRQLHNLRSKNSTRGRT